MQKIGFIAAALKITAQVRNYAFYAQKIDARKMSKRINLHLSLSLSLLFLFISVVEVFLIQQLNIYDVYFYLSSILSFLISSL